VKPPDAVVGSSHVDLTMLIWDEPAGTRAAREVIKRLDRDHADSKSVLRDTLDMMIVLIDDHVRGYSTPQVSWDRHSRSAGRSLWHPEG